MKPGQCAKGTREGEACLVVSEPVSPRYDVNLMVWLDFALVC